MIRTFILVGLAVFLGLAWGCSGNGGGRNSTDSEPQTSTDSDTSSVSETSTDSGSDSDLPESCAAAGATCGVIQLVTGAWTDCGACEAPKRCGALEPNQCDCEPVTCEWAGADCGTIDDGCGHTLECGTCAGLATCGGSLRPNVCAAPLCNDYCWCAVSPYPQADDLSMVYFDNDGALWVGGADGQLLVQRDGVWAIVPVYTRTPSDLHAMVRFGPEDGWIVGKYGAILKDEDTRFHYAYLDKEQKTQRWSPVAYDLNDLWAASSTSIWVAGAGGVLHWDGQAWAEARSSAGALYAVEGKNEDDLWFAGVRNNVPFILHKQGLVYAVADLGLPQLKGSIRDLILDDAGVLYAVGQEYDASGAVTGGFVLRQTGEESWERLDQGDLPYGLLSGAFDERGTLIAVGEQGGLATFDGEVVRPALSLWGSGRLHRIAQGKDGLLVVGETGLIATSHHGFLFPNIARSPVAPGGPEAVSVAFGQDVQFSAGDGFSLLWTGTSFGYAPMSASVVGLFGVGPGTVFAAGNQDGDAVILRYDGVTWTEVARAESEVASGLDGTSSTDVRARLTGHRVLHFDGQTSAIRAADDLPPGPNKEETATPWTISDQGLVRHAMGQAEVWGAWPMDGLTEMPHRAAGVGEQELWSVGPDGAIRFDGERWQRIVRDAAMSDLAVAADETVWIVGTSGEQGGPLWRFEAGALVDVGFEAEDELHAISITADGNIFVAGDAVYQLDGSEWTVVLPGNGTAILDIAALSETDIWAGRGFDLLHLEGGQWVTRPTVEIQDVTPLSEDTRVVVHTIFAISPDEVLIAGETYDKVCFVMIGYVDGQFHSRPMCSMYEEATVNDVWALSADDAFVTVGQVGWVFHYLHAVGMFDTVDAVTADPLGALWGRAGGDKWAFGADGVIAHGVPWTDPACQ